MLVHFSAKNHPQQIRAGGALDVVDDRATDPAFFARLHERFRFTIDVCASARNAKLPRYWTTSENGLAQSWAGERVWCNPPFSQIRPWVQKAHAEQEAEVVVMLLPANRTEQAWWQELVEPHRDRGFTTRTLRVEFLPGRLRFIRADKHSIGPNERPPFGCCLLIWQKGPR